MASRPNYPTTGLLVEARGKIAAKLREEAVVRGARRVVGKAVEALDAALAAVAKYGRET